MLNQNGQSFLKYTVLIAVIFLFNCEKEVSSDRLVERNGLKYEVNSEKPFSGKSVEYYDDGKVKRESISYKDGQLHGVFQTWIETGQLFTEKYYEKGMKNGSYKEWLDNGQLYAEVLYKNDLRNGLAQHWFFENGQLEYKTMYRNDQAEGKYIAWYKNGVKKLVGYYHGGQKDSLWTYWDEQGEQQREQTYKNDILTNIRLLQSVTDIDGNVYETINIGGQVWMAKNLKVTHYREGTKILQIANSEWIGTTSGALCYYNNDDSQTNASGALYNWYAVSDKKNMAPEGWHVASDTDWTLLSNYFKSNSDEIRFWQVFGGRRSGYKGNYEGSDTVGYFWAAREISSRRAPIVFMGEGHSDILPFYANKRDGLSVRCVKD